MQEMADDLELLLRDIRKNILDNDQFLKTLVTDSAGTEVADQPGTAEPAGEEDDFEEL